MEDKIKLAEEYANRTVLECDGAESGREEVSTNFIEGYDYLKYSLEEVIDKRFNDEFGFYDDSSDSDKSIVKNCFSIDFKAGLLFALADELDVNINMDKFFEDEYIEDDFMNVNVINKSKHRLPEYATSESAGFDFKANIDEPWVIHPMERVLVPTGMYFEVPSGYELMVRPRSGMALKSGVTVLNTPGCVDSDYRGEVGIILINLSTDNFVINPGDRVAQGVISPVAHVKMKEVSSLSETERGEGGFGHSGK